MNTIATTFAQPTAAIICGKRPRVRDSWVVQIIPRCFGMAKVAIFSYAADSGVFRDSSDVSGVIGTVIASV
jgi:hypothetical protein